MGGSACAFLNDTKDVLTTYSRDLTQKKSHTAPSDLSVEGLAPSRAMPLPKETLP